MMTRRGEAGTPPSSRLTMARLPSAPCPQTLSVLVEASLRVGLVVVVAGLTGLSGLPVQRHLGGRGERFNGSFSRFDKGELEGIRSSLWCRSYTLLRSSRTFLSIISIFLASFINIRLTFCTGFGSLTGSFSLSGFLLLMIWCSGRER